MIRLTGEHPRWLVNGFGAAVVYRFEGSEMQQSVIGLANPFFDYLTEKRRVLRAVQGGPECLLTYTNANELVFQQ